jgi:hypothetical protein
MFKKILILTAMMVVMMIELPFTASAATTTRNAWLNTNLNKPQVFQIRIGRRHRYYRPYREYPRTYVSGYRWVPEYYWVNGVRYVRYVRVYDNDYYNY